MLYNQLTEERKIYIYTLFYYYIITLTDAYWFLLWIQITVWDYLLSIWRSSFNIYYKADLLISIFFTFSLFENSIFLFLKDLLDVKILDCFIFLFQHIEYVIMLSSAYIVSDANSAISLIGTIIYSMNKFSFAAFKVFSL